MRWMVGVGMMALLAVGMAALGQGTEPAKTMKAPSIQAKSPFTISNETTAITGPMQADGTVGYVDAINDKYGIGVTTDNNGFATWLKVVGAGDLAPKTKEVVLLVVGVKASPAGAEVWEGYEEQMKRRLGLSEDKLNHDFVASATDDAKRAVIEAYDAKVGVIRDELRGAARGLWRAEGHPDLAASIQGQEKLLAMAAQAADKPRWWVPALPRDGRSLMSALQTTPHVSDIAETMCARAMLRATTGDMAGFLKDIRTVRQLARHIGGGPSVTDRLAGGNMEMRATDAMAGWAASGTLTQG